MSQLEIPKLFSKSKINLFKKREGMNFYKKINLRTNYQQIKNQTQKKLGIEKRKFYSENTTICPSFSREKSSYYSPTGIKRIPPGYDCCNFFERPKYPFHQGSRTSFLVK